MERRNEVIHGDCADVLKEFADNTFDAMVTDPPAGIAFMNRAWDKDKGGRRQWIAWMSSVMEEALRTLKPGAHAFVWALPRTSHWTATALEDAGFEIRDVVYHCFGSGFPKSLDISKAIDKMQGADREKVRPIAIPARNRNGTNALGGSWQDAPWETSPATAEAQQWQGWGTALKPSGEHWILCRKPIGASSIAANVLRWGTGGINVDGCRIQAGDMPMHWSHPRGGIWQTDTAASGELVSNDAGRWPPNVVMTHSLWCTDGACAADCPVALLDAQSGVLRSGGEGIRGNPTNQVYGKENRKAGSVVRAIGDTGTASRFFPTFRYDADDVPFRYEAKPDRTERNQGCELLESVSAAAMVDREPDSAGMQSPRAGAGRTSGARNQHPTVKPLSLMRWLCRLVTPSGGLLLDPFCGSGTTLMAAAREGFGYIGIDQDEQFCRIARHRVASEHGLWEAWDKAAGETE